MGVDYSAVAAYGKQFRTRSKLEEFVQEYYEDAEIEDEVYEVPELQGLQVIGLNAYSGNDWILGWEVEVGEDLTPYKEKWKQIFPNHPDDASPQLEVKVY